MKRSVDVRLPRKLALMALLFAVAITAYVLRGDRTSSCALELVANKYGFMVGAPACGDQLMFAVGAAAMAWFYVLYYTLLTFGMWLLRSWRSRRDEYKCASTGSR